MLAIRDATPDDAPAVRSIALQAWPSTYAGLLSDEFIRIVLERTYDEDALRGLIEDAARDPGACFLVAESDGEVAGYLHFSDGGHGPELHRLYLRPELTRRGIGRALLDELNSRLAPGSEYVALVHSGNEGALRFYERHGFEPAGRVDGPALYLEREGILGEAPREPGCDVLVRYRVPGRTG